LKKLKNKYSSSKTLWVVLGFILFISPSLYAQNQDTTIFLKGRVLTSLVGSVSNQSSALESGNIIKTTAYSIGTQSGIFLQNKWVLGVNFNLSRSAFDNTSESLVSEDLLIGVWSRLYFAEHGATSLYFELTPYYVGVFRKNIFIDNQGNEMTNEITTGKGYGILPGLGLSYNINRNVGFGMTLSYSYAHLQVDNEDIILNEITPDSYNVSQLQFSFNFQIYIDQFFF